MLFAAYRAELDRVGLWDRDLLRRNACERLRSDLAAWNGEPVLAYGFEDLTAAEWSLLEALAGRAEVCVSLPYEPGRAAFASLARTAGDLAALAAGRVEELRRARRSSPPRPSPTSSGRCSSRAPSSRPSDLPSGSSPAPEGAGHSSWSETSCSALIRDGTRPEEIAVIVPSVERYRALLETVFGSLGIPYGIEATVRFPLTPLGHALLSLLRFTWGGGGRRELYSFLRSPYSGIGRTGVDFVEGRLRGRAIDAPGRVEEETERLREAPLVALRELRDAPSPLEGVRALAGSMVRSAYGLDAPPTGDQLGSTCARSPRSPSSSTSSPRSSRQVARSSRRSCSRLSYGSMSRGRRPAGPDALPFSTCFGRGHATSTRSSFSGSRRAASRDAARARRSSTTTGARSSAPGSSGRIR